MTNPESTVLDLSGCKYILEIHQRIKEAFGFPDYYGCNWDAFRDAFITVGVPEKIIIRGEETLPKDLREHMTHMHQTLDRIQEKFARNGWPFSYEIES